MIAEVVAGLLVELGACTPARAWLAQAGSWDRAWDECPRYGWNGWLVWRLREREAISDAAFYGLLAKLARDVVDASGVDPAPYHAALDAYTAFIGSAGPERNVRWAEAEAQRNAIKQRLREHASWADPHFWAAEACFQATHAVGVPSDCAVADLVRLGLRRPHRDARLYIESEVERAAFARAAKPLVDAGLAELEARRLAL